MCFLTSDKYAPIGHIEYYYDVCHKVNGVHFGPGIWATLTILVST